MWVLVYVVLIYVGTSIASAANDLNITQQLASSVPGFGSPLPTIGTNVEGGSVFSNFVRFHEDGQFFFKIAGGLIRFEQPEAEPLHGRPYFGVVTLHLLVCQTLIKRGLTKLDMPDIVFGLSSLILQMVELVDHNSHKR